ncbi:MAG TPA: DUF1993 domain-containing protein [Burkholderiaceae bacterium]
MTISMYAASVPVFRQMLGSLSAVLAKAETHATERKIEPDALVKARLFPDMLPLYRQVEIACDFAKGVSARLAGVDVPVYAAAEAGFAQAQERIATTLAFIDSLAPAQIDGSESRQIVIQPGTPRERAFAGQAYLLGYGLPQFFFHITTAYALLRHNGLAIGKKDYMGVY